MTTPPADAHRERTLGRDAPVRWHEPAGCTGSGRLMAPGPTNARQHVVESSLPGRYACGLGIDLGWTHLPWGDAPTLYTRQSRGRGLERLYDLRSGREVRIIRRIQAARREPTHLFCD